MIVFVIVIGLAGSELVNWAADYLPRYSSSAPAQHCYPWRGLLWGLRTWVRGDRSPWLILHLVTVGLSLAATIGLGIIYGPTLDFVFYTTCALYLLLVAVIDLKYRLVLNLLIYPAIVIVAVMSDNKAITLMGGTLAFGVFVLTAWLRPGDVGAGDIKLAALLGLAFGFPGVLWALLVGIGSGGVATVALLLGTDAKLKTRIPYAPFLCLGAAIALIYNPFLSFG